MPPANGGGLFEPTSSDDESEQLNRIREKLQRRRTPAACDEHSSSDSGDNSKDEGDDDSSSEDESVEPGKAQTTSSKHWEDKDIALRIATSTYSTLTSTENSTGNLGAKTSKRDDKVHRQPNTAAAITTPSSTWNEADDDSFDAELAAMEVLPIKANSANSRPLSGASSTDDSFADISEEELAAIDLRNIQPSTESSSTIIPNTSSLGINGTISGGQVHPATKHRSIVSSKATESASPEPSNGSLSECKRGDLAIVTRVVQSEHSSKAVQTDTSPIDNNHSFDDAELAVVELAVVDLTEPATTATIKSAKNTQRPSPQSDHGSFQGLDGEELALANDDDGATKSCDALLEGDSFADMDGAVILASASDNDLQKTDNHTSVRTAQQRVNSTQSAPVSPNKAGSDMFTMQHVGVPHAAKNPYRTTQKRLAVQQAANPEDDQAFGFQSTPPAFQARSHAGHSCEYEEPSSGDEWYFEASPSANQADPAADTSNADAFGFEIEPTTDRAARASEQGDKYQVSIHARGISNNRDDNHESNLEVPRRGDNGTTNNNTRSLSGAHCDQNDATVNVDEAFGFGEHSVPTRSDMQLASESVHERASEIDPSLYAPQPCDVTQEPIVHHFTARNRPVHVRKLIPVSQLYEAPVSTLWKTKFDTFNQLQSEIANMLAYSDDNVVVSAPTGAGKTAVFEMAMARFFAVDLQATPPGRGIKPQISKRRKIVYVSPSKALIEERFADWSKRLSEMQLGIEIAVVTGDGDPAGSFHDLASAHFILTTPEKWDSLTRRWTENFFLFASVKLFMIDEVHLMADESRGCCLEAIVCRMKTIQLAASRVEVSQADLSGGSSYASTSPDAVNSLLRFVAVSATLPNISDFATFFDANEAHTFDDSYRPVPLTTHVVGQGKIGDASKGQYFFWQNLDRNVPEIIIRFSNRRPAIVFCHSKVDCEKLADFLAVTNNIGHRDGATSQMASQTRVSKLQRVLLHGIGYHHAGLDVDDRRLVERSFLNGKIRVICATSTIAMGVNLPAHLVVIKGTSAWRGAGEGGGYQDIDQATLLQMIGRAGRPGFDTSGTAVIMTDNESKARFEKLASSGLSPAKSQLKGDKLVETINTEISQRVITSTESAIHWIKGTLYFVQLIKDSDAHGVKVVSNHSIDTHLLNLCKNAIERLSAVGALVIADGQEIYPLAASHIMSHRLVDCNAMEQISKLPFDASQCQVLKALASIEGLQRPVRKSEKKALNAAHKNMKLYKLDGPLSKARVKEPWEKAFVLLQAYVEELELEGNDYALRQEMNAMVDYATRMLSAIEEYSAKGSKHGNVVAQSLKIRRSLAVHLWSAQDGILRQIKGIGKTLAFSLHMSGISTFDDAMKSSEAQIEKAAHRPPPFGADLRKASARILRSRLKISAAIETANGSLAPSSIICTLKGSHEIGEAESESGGKAAAIAYTLIVHTDRPGGSVLFKENIAGSGTYRGLLPLKFGKITLRLIASIVGLDDTLELEGNDGMAPSSRSIAQPKPVLRGVSEKRIRDANQKKGEALASQFRPRVTGVQDPRVARTTTAAVSRNPSRGAPPSSRAEETPDNASVTPSPKLMSSMGQAYNPASGTSRVRQFPPPSSTSISPSRVEQRPLHSSKSISTSTHLAMQQPPNRSGHAEKQMPTQQTWNGSYGDQSAPRQDQWPAYAPPDRSQDQQVQPSSRWESTREGSLKRSPEPSHTDHDARFSNGVASWKRMKSQQQKSQQRAFVHKKDNPFSLYKHDPNDTESYLDLLSSQNKEASQNGIIPPEGFIALANANKARTRSSITCGVARGNPQHQPNQRGRQRGRRDSFGKVMSTQELLSQKAAEQNLHMTIASTSPAFDSGRSPYMQPENSYHQMYQGPPTTLFHHIRGQPTHGPTNALAGYPESHGYYGINQNERHSGFREPGPYALSYAHDDGEYEHSYSQQYMHAEPAVFHGYGVSSYVHGDHPQSHVVEQMQTGQQWEPGFASQGPAPSYGSGPKRDCS